MVERSVCRELKALNNVIMRHLEKSLPHDLDKITASNVWILIHLARNRDRDVFGRDIEEAFSITRSTVSKVIEIMENKGLVVRESVDYDARLKKLVLTDKAEQVIKKMEETGNMFEKTVMQDFSDEEKQQFFGYILRMKANVERFDGKE